MSFSETIRIGSSNSCILTRENPALFRALYSGFVELNRNLRVLAHTRLMYTVGAVQKARDYSMCLLWASSTNTVNESNLGLPFDMSQRAECACDHQPRCLFPAGNRVRGGLTRSWKTISKVYLISGYSLISLVYLFTSTSLRPFLV